MHLLRTLSGCLVLVLLALAVPASGDPLPPPVPECGGTALGDHGAAAVGYCIRTNAPEGECGTYLHVRVLGNVYGPSLLCS
jgi:hypothetical protein